MNKTILALKKVIHKALAEDGIETNLIPSKELKPAANPNQQVIELLQKSLKSEYHQWDLYYSYKDQLLGKERDQIVAHFEEHAGEEAMHIGILQKYLVNSFKTMPTKERIPVEVLNSTDPVEILKFQLKFEQEAVQNYTNFLNFLENNKGYEALALDIEGILITEQAHVHDFEAMVN